MSADLLFIFQATGLFLEEVCRDRSQQPKEGGLETSTCAKSIQPFPVLHLYPVALVFPAIRQSKWVPLQLPKVKASRVGPQTVDKLHRSLLPSYIMSSSCMQFMDHCYRLSPCRVDQSHTTITVWQDGNASRTKARVDVEDHR